MAILNYALFAQDAYQRSETLTDALDEDFNGSKILASKKKDSDGFYAIAYDTGSEIVISYRGTDGVFKDVLNGWGGGAGLWFSDQFQLAMEFYHEVRDANPGKTISLTGHSLGGGLAGFVSSITGAEAHVFDNMTYKLSAKLAYFTAKIAEAISDVSNVSAAQVNSALDSTIKSLGFTVVDVVGETGKLKVDVGILGFSPVILAVDAITDLATNAITNLFTLAESYYKGLPVNHPSTIENITQYAADDEILEVIRNLSGTDASTVYYDPYFGGSKRYDFAEVKEIISESAMGFAASAAATLMGGPFAGAITGGIYGALRSVGRESLGEALTDTIGSRINKHSMSLLTANIYLQEKFSSQEQEDIGFLGGAIHSHLYSDEVAKKIGISGEDGAAAAQLFNEIAYTSASGDGTPYGDTALQAMFDDAKDAGKILERADYNFNLGLTFSDYEVRGALGSAIVQFSGELAHSKNSNKEMLKGFIRTDNDRLISVDFSETLWKEASGKSSYDVASIIGREAIIDRFDFDDIFKITGISDNIEDAMKALWNADSTDDFERLHFVATDELKNGLSLNLQDIDSEFKINGSSFGSLSGKGDVIFGTDFNDTITGSDRNELIDGGDGSDILKGGGGDDILVASSGNDETNYIDGGSGKDIVVFSESLGEYQITALDDSHQYDFLVEERGVYIPFKGWTLTGNKTYLKDVQIGQFDWGKKYTFGEDGPTAQESLDLQTGDGDKIGVITIEAPSFAVDSNIEFSLNLSTSGIGTQYRIALIIDVSGSMGGSRIAEAKAAYVDLINYLKNQGIADVSEFAVIPFNSSASLYEGLDADAAITRINSLGAGGGTSFGPAISRGLEFFDGTKDGVSNIAYFLSDGQGSGASTSLQAVADVRAFGIGSGASIGSLNTIDSNNAVILNSASDLAASFTESEIKTADVDKIEIYLNNALSSTITGDQLTDNGATGLSYSGTIEGLDTENSDTLEAKVFFKDTSIPAQTVTFNVADGKTEAKGSDGDDTIAFSLSQKDVDAGGGTDTILANDLDNTVIKLTGNGVIKTFGGNDTVQAGDNRSSGLDRVIDGGDGVDTVVYTGKRSEYTVSVTGGLVKVGTATDSLSNVEHIQFDDMKIRTSDLTAIQTVSIAAVEITESDTDSTLSFTVKLDAASSTAITFDYSTANVTAESGSDYLATTGSITLTAGETEKTIDVTIKGDSIYESDETFELQLSNLNGAVFENGQATYSAVGTIKNDDDENKVETGSSGDDVINAGKGNDQINSGSGNDIVNANLGNDVVIDGLGNNSLNGQGGLDALIAFSGINTSSGGAGSDFLLGGFQADSLDGGAGNDVLRGDAGNFMGGSDTLAGGQGDDLLMGGKGSDTFVFNTNEGSDTIAALNIADMGYGPLSGYTGTPNSKDFQTGVDHIKLNGFSGVDASNVLSSITDGANGAVFSAEGTEITFYGVDANQLTTDDFIFA